AHSAALACQCSSRNPPGTSDISTPAIACDTGKSTTVASFAQPPSQVLGATAPSRKRKDGSSAPASGAGVGPNGGCPCPKVSVLVAAAAMPPAAVAPGRVAAGAGGPRCAGRGDLGIRNPPGPKARAGPRRGVPRPQPAIHQTRPPLPPRLFPRPPAPPPIKWRPHARHPPRAGRPP